jgi:spermidine/putrescine transport system ATP-binding protein
MTAAPAPSDASAPLSPRSGGAIDLVSLRKDFDDVAAVDGIDIAIPSGEFFALLGPSGCGKTTTLRLIAGFERPTGGQILLDGVDLSQTPPNKRPVNTVFQSYALFPHMNVRENVGYGLRWVKGLSKQERIDKVDRVIAQVRLTELADRRPGQMSGGQQQRVALARALVLNPRVLLLDEPLGALDAKLRKELRGELTAVHREVGITFLLVTHDQEEALEMSDRLAVMNLGRVAQCGTPQEVYEQPQTEFVADFLGAANVLDVELVGPAGPGRRTVTIGGHEVVASAPADESTFSTRAVIRPERLRVFTETGVGGSAPSSTMPRIPGIVDQVVYVGPVSQVRIRLPHGPAVQALLMNEDGAPTLTSGTPVKLGIDADAIRILQRDVAAESEAGSAAEPALSGS